MVRLGDWGGLGARKHTAVDGLELALCFTVVLDANGAAFAGRVRGHYGGFGLMWDGNEGCVVRLWSGCSKKEAMECLMEQYSGRWSRS